jgi:hypothetical protein
MQINPKVIFAVFLGFVFLFSINAFKESDAFYHLKTGEIIWETKAIPTADIFSYTAPGAHWVTHEWLGEILFYGLYRLGGFWAVILFVALLAAKTYGLLLHLAVKRGVPPLLAAFALFAIGSLTFELWIPRPQVFSFSLTAALLTLLEEYRTSGNKKYLFGAGAIILVWANMHASVLLGIALIAGYAAALWLEERRHLAGPLIVLLPAAAAISLLNPNGYEVWLYPLYIAPAVSQLNIAEWASLSDYLHLSESRAFAAQILVANFLLIVWLIRKRRMDYVAAGLIWTASILPFISIRHVGFWPILAGVPLTVVIADILKRVPLRLSAHHMKIALFGVLGLLLVGRALHIPRQYFNQDTVPVHAANFMAEHGLTGTRFNLYNEGGYLLWRFGPEQKVFVDGRSEVYPPEVLQDLRAITLVDPDWDELVYKKYEIDHFLLAYRPDQLAETLLPLVRKLMKDGWPLVYWDDASLVFVKPTEAHRELIQTFGLAHVSPYRDMADIPAEETDSTVREFDRLLDLVPHSKVVQAYAGQFLSNLKAPL